MVKKTAAPPYKMYSMTKPVILSSLDSIQGIQFQEDRKDYTLDGTFKSRRLRKENFKKGIDNNVKYC